MSYNVTVSGTDYEGIDNVKLPLTGENKYKIFSDSDGIVDGTVTSFESDNITKIMKYKFMGCSNLTSVKTPNVIEIGIGAFDSCSNLEEFIFDNVQDIGNTAFYGCKKITGELNFPSLKNPLGTNCFNGCTGITKVVMPNVVGTGSGMFNGCTALKVIDLGNAINTATGSRAFASQSFVNCSALEAVIIRATSGVPTAFSTDIFTGTPIAGGTASDSCFIYVPSALVDSYKSASVWSTFANQIRAIEDYPDICG